MKLWIKAKDGGVESTVTGYWLIEAKRFFSALLLRFDGQSREAFHSHAFNSISWVLKGELKEQMLDGSVKIHRPSLWPVITRRNDFHKVDSSPRRTWVLSFRGRWSPKWREYDPFTGRFRTLTAGRVEVQ